MWAGLTQITLVAAVLIAATALLLVAKRRALRRRTVASGPTWGCGFTAVNTRMQYTGESFVEGLESIVHPFTEEVVEGKAVDKQEIFPSAHDFDIRRKDRVARLFSAWWVESLRLLNARVMRLRTGKINHYILFALLFITAPALYLAAAVTALLFIPVGDLPPVVSFPGDLVCFIYLLALSRAALILAAMDTGSSFEGMGASREALYGALVEPALLLTTATLALMTGHTSFAAIFSAATPVEVRFTIILLLLGYLLTKIFIVEQGRIPVDDPRTHLELTMIHEVMCLDYGGIDLAFIQIAGWLKGAALAVLAADTLLLGGALHWWWAAPLAVLLPGLAVGVVESTQARNKLSRNATFLLTIAALAALIFFVALLLHLNIDIR